MKLFVRFCFRFESTQRPGEGGEVLLFTASGMAEGRRRGGGVFCSPLLAMAEGRRGARWRESARRGEAVTGGGELTWAECLASTMRVGGVGKRRRVTTPEQTAGRGKLQVVVSACVRGGGRCR